ncbi:RNA polymerase sigma factor [Aridibaculum aurantiacum]|uniref:RNA polymerase sigma factor n=1 Tax=Aridibaculum aurantiacum TaxID=2810307 RepID=UPI001A95D4CB|nr:hypothetical protein [Aridibaculum aurantiacum]
MKNPSTELLGSIILLCQQGDRESQRLLYDHFSPAMYTYCLENASTTAEAETLLLQGFLQVFDKISEFQPGADLEAWTLGIFQITISQYQYKKILCATEFPSVRMTTERKSMDVFQVRNS